MQTQARVTPAEPFFAAAASQKDALVIESLAYAPFAALFALDDAELERIGARRMIATEVPGFGYPCRVSLAFAKAGEELLLVNHRHLDMPTTPYRAEGPIFVRRDAQEFGRSAQFPEIVMKREMAVRAYDHAGIMVEAELAGGEALKALAAEWLARPEIAHVDIHSARRGCFFCRVRRAEPDFAI